MLRHLCRPRAMPANAIDHTRCLRNSLPISSNVSSSLSHLDSHRLRRTVAQQIDADLVGGPDAAHQVEPPLRIRHAHAIHCRDAVAALQAELRKELGIASGSPPVAAAATVVAEGLALQQIRHNLRIALELIAE